MSWPRKNVSAPPKRTPKRTARHVGQCVSNPSTSHQFTLRFPPFDLSTLQLSSLPSSLTMASMMKEVAKRASNMVVKGSTAEAWETTAKLRTQYVYTTMDAMPARVAEASKEWAEIRAKVVSREMTVNDIGAAVARAAELYAFYVVGRTIGGRALPA